MRIFHRVNLSNLRRIVDKFCLEEEQDVVIKKLSEHLYQQGFHSSVDVLHYKDHLPMMGKNLVDRLRKMFNYSLIDIHFS